MISPPVLFFLFSALAVFIFLSARVLRTALNKRRSGEPLTLGDKVKLTFVLFFLIGIIGELFETVFAGAKDVFRIIKVAAFVAGTFIIYNL